MFDTFDLNDAGEVAFLALLADGPNLGGLFVASTGTVTQIVAAGDPAPGPGDGVFEIFVGVSINDTGDVAFQAGVSEDGTDGIFLHSGGIVSAVVLVGVEAPDTGGGA